MQPARFRQDDILLVEINNAKSTSPAAQGAFDLIFLISFLACTEINIKWKQSMILYFRLQRFHFKTLQVQMPV